MPATVCASLNNDYRGMQKTSCLLIFGSSDYIVINAISEICREKGGLLNLFHGLKFEKPPGVPQCFTIVFFLNPAAGGSQYPHQSVQVSALFFTDH